MDKKEDRRKYNGGKPGVGAKKKNQYLKRNPLSVRLSIREYEEEDWQDEVIEQAERSIKRRIEKNKKRN